MTNDTEGHMEDDLSRFYAERLAGESPGRVLGMNGVPNEAYSALNMVLDSSLNGAVSSVISSFKSIWGRVARNMPLIKTTENQNPEKIREKKGWLGELENPDTYLFLLCSSGLKNTLQQGRATFIIRQLLRIPKFGEFEDISQASTKIAEKLEIEGVDTVLNIEELIRSLVTLLWSKCDKSYEDKKIFAKDLAELVTQLLVKQSEEMTPGEKVKKILNFAKKHGVLEVFIENNQKIAKLASEIWGKKSELTERIGFDKTAVKAMEPVIALVLKEGLKDEKSFPITASFSSVLVDMIAMDHASREKPTLVNLTDTIFQLAASNTTIKDKLSSKGEKKLTDEANGILEFLRGFSINALKINGLGICLQNELTNLENQKKELVDFMNKRKAQGAEKSRGLVVMIEESKKLTNMLDVLQNAEIGQRTDDKLQLLNMVSEYKREEVKKGPECRSRAKKLLDKVNDFSKVHHLCSEEKEYMTNISQEKTFFMQKKHELELEKGRTDFNSTFLTVNKEIMESRKHVAEMLTQIKAGHMSHHELACFSFHDQQEMIRVANKNGLDKAEVNIILATPEMQRKVRYWKGKEAERNNAQIQGVSKEQLKHMQVEEDKALKSCIKEIHQGLVSKKSWTTKAVTMIVSCLMSVKLTGIDFFLSAYRWREKGREKRGVPIDESLPARLIKSVNMIKQRNPEFWKKMNQIVGADIRGVLKLLVAERNHRYLYTRPKHIEENIRNIFDYVVRQGISVEKTYEPVNLLLSIWTDPESFNARYDELKRQVREKKIPTPAKKNLRCDDHLGLDSNKKPRHKKG